MTTTRLRSHTARSRTAAHNTLIALATATAVSAAGLLTLAAPVQAQPMMPPNTPSPACDQWVFNGEFVAVGAPQEGTTWVVTFHPTGHLATGDAVVAFADGGNVTGHVVDGYVYRAIAFNIQFGGDPSNVWHFKG